MIILKTFCGRPLRSGCTYIAIYNLIFGLAGIAVMIYMLTHGRNSVRKLSDTTRTILLSGNSLSMMAKLYSGILLSVWIRRLEPRIFKLWLIATGGTVILESGMLIFHVILASSGLLTSLTDAGDDEYEKNWQHKTPAHNAEPASISEELSQESYSAWRTTLLVVLAVDVVLTPYCLAAVYSYWKTLRSQTIADLVVKYMMPKTDRPGGVFLIPSDTSDDFKPWERRSSSPFVAIKDTVPLASPRGSGTGTDLGQKRPDIASLAHRQSELRRHSNFSGPREFESFRNSHSYRAPVPLRSTKRTSFDIKDSRF